MAAQRHEDSKNLTQNLTTVLVCLTEQLAKLSTPRFPVLLPKAHQQRVRWRGAPFWAPFSLFDFVHVPSETLKFSHMFASLSSFVPQATFIL